MRVLQETLFPFEEILKLEPKDQIEKYFLVLDEMIGNPSRKTGIRGPKAIPFSLLLRSFLVMKIFSIKSVVLLRERLNHDKRLKLYCGFKYADPIPSEATFSRFINYLASNDKLLKLFYAVVEKGKTLGIIGDEARAIDSTDISAYETKQPKKKINQDGTKADWGSKKDSNGNQLTWFGYKLHIVVDPKSECPINLELTPASVNDGDMAPGLIKEEYKTLPKERPVYFIMDAGYDQYKVYESVVENKCRPIIPLNLRGEKQPPPGVDVNGTPVCSAGFTMVYWGDSKFRCPHVLGKVDCPFGSNWCSSSNYGLVVKINPKDDPRRFCIPHRGSRNWKELYNLRSSVERAFSRLKNNLSLEDFNVRGIKKVMVHMLLSSICLVAGTIAANQKVCCESAA